MAERKQYRAAPAMQLARGTRYRAVLHTNFGDMTAELYPDDAPQTVNNFVFLAREGFYTNVPFHRIIRDFMAQTGDPGGTGTGGPGYRFNDEPVRREYERGTLAMANAGPNTNGSQFFICHRDLSGRLPKNYTIFGKLVEGLDVLDTILNVPVQRSPRGEPSVPTMPITLESVEIEETKGA